ncbi:MAG: hypothetical protein E7041_06355 [Lentisphaerae bacterium]|nr:hypothetical protein [Lentisphaerota bacterium]
MEKYSFPAKIICILGWNGVNFSGNETDRTDGRILLVKYAHADDEVSLIKPRYTFSTEGLIELHSVAKD